MAVATFLTKVTIFLADLAVDEAMDNRDGNERDETPLGAILNADLKQLPVFRVSFMLGGLNCVNNLNAD